MKKLLKIFLVLILMIAFSMNLSVFATEENKSSEENEAIATVAAADEKTTQNNSTNDKATTQVTTVASVNDGELSISDILNILLIATGIVIILLAIAIFIKLK